MQQEDIRRQWETQIAALTRRVNLGWWLERWLPLLLIICLVGVVGLLVVRSLAIAYAAWSWVALAGTMGLSMIAAWWMARGRFESREAARVRLEDALQLKTQLSAAAAGVGPWPVMRAVPRIVTWQWQRPLALVIAAAGMLALAAWVPIDQITKDKPRMIEPPTAVKQVQQWVDELRKENALDPKSLAEVEKKMEDLMRRPNDQWYEHASLEAAEHLRDETGKNLQELGSQLEQTKGSLSTMAELGNKLSDEAKSGITKQMQDNLNGLRSGAMSANSDLMQQLKDMDPKSMNGMSKEHLQKLAERLKQNADALRKAMANAPQFDFKECKNPQPGDCEKDGPGKGGTGGGREKSDLTMKKDETNLNQRRTETAKTMVDPERLAPGDMLGLQDAKPTTDETSYTGPRTGGALQSAGDGGAAVEKSTLIPAERAALKRFFK